MDNGTVDNPPRTRPRPQQSSTTTAIANTITVPLNQNGTTTAITIVPAITRARRIQRETTGKTPRSVSWTPPRHTINARSTRRSHSAGGARTDELSDEEHRQMTEAAYQAWLERKNKMPKSPRCTPNREQIKQYLKENSRHKMYNCWLAWHTKYDPVPSDNYKMRNPLW